MSKKSKKRRLSSPKSAAMQKSPAQPTLTGSAAAPSAQPGSRSSVSRSQGSFEFNPDYGYVIKDLKRIGIMAGSFFIVLIVLSFFLR